MRLVAIGMDTNEQFEIATVLLIISIAIGISLWVVIVWHAAHDYIAIHLFYMHLENE